MKNLFAVSVVVLALALASVAQTPEAPSNIYAAGLSFNNSASPSIAGTGLYARQVIGSGTYVLAVVDVLPNTLKPFTVTTIFSPGVAQKFATLGNVTLYSLSSAGLAYNGSNTGWGWTAGGAASVPIGKTKWRAFPNVRVAKSSVSNGTGYQLTLGSLFGRAF
jgi:hypothetical protein